MNNLLLEEINRFKLLSGYNPELTLTENHSLLNEQFRNMLLNYTDDAIKLLGAEAKNLSMFKGMTDDAVQGFFKSLQKGKGNAKQVSQFQDELLKTGIKGGQLGGLSDAAVDGYVKQLMNSSAPVATKFKGAAKADRFQMLKDAGYPESTINAIIKKTDDLAGAGKQAAATAGKTTTQQATQAAATTAKKNIAQKGLDLARKYKDRLINSIKTSGWKRTLSIAAGLGVGAAALWMLAKENGATAQDMPAEQPADTGGTGGAGSSGGGGTRYTIPQELEGPEGVKDFQNWLDQNHPGWVRKYGTLGGDVRKGFGKFGPSTNAAWQDETKKNAYLQSKQQTPEIQKVDSTVPIKTADSVGIQTPTQLPTTAPKITPPQQ